VLTGKRITLIISGSIAAYKSLELIRLLVKEGASVEGVLTEGAAAFLAPLSVEALTGKRAHTKLWDERSYQMNHIDLSRRADLIVIAPATATMIGKLANGIGDDLASSVLLARNKPVLAAPSMNTEMWENPAFARNLARARADGLIVVPPLSDTLACGEVGIGKMAEPASILSAVQAHFSQSQPLAGKSAVVTTGGTIERIDSVRYLSNFSSGRQGNAIATALAEAGAAVTLVAASTRAALPAHPGVQVVDVESALDMHAAVHAALPCDLFVGCAAVCDFRVANPRAGKIKKEKGLNLQFEENPDIAKSIGTLPASERPALVIGFAAETEALKEHAQKKLFAKGCDLVVANDVSSGAVFGQEQNTVSFISKDSVVDYEAMPKSEVAREICQWVEQAIGTPRT